MTNPIHNDVSENTIFLLFDKPSGEANAMGTLINYFCMKNIIDKIIFLF